MGRMPPCFSLGLGKVVMPYLREEEKMPAFIKGLSEAAGMGHVIPDYETLLQKGLDKTSLLFSYNRVQCYVHSGYLSTFIFRHP